MIDKKRLAAACLALLIAAVLLISLAFIACEADHVCAGDNCPVCAVVSLCRDALKTLAGCFVAAAAVFACVCVAAAALTFYRVDTICGKTPVLLKDVLLN